MSRPELQPTKRTRALWVLRVGVAAGLVASAVVHVQLAPGYQQAAPGGLGQGTLFLIQAGTAALAAVILYRYVQVPALGPLPSMYEPVWYTAKTLTAVAEAAAGALAVAGYALQHKTRPGSRPAARDRRRGAATP